MNKCCIKQRVLQTIFHEYGTGLHISTILLNKMHFYAISIQWDFGQKLMFYLDLFSTFFIYLNAFRLIKVGITVSITIPLTFYLTKRKIKNFVLNKTKINVIILYLTSFNKAILKIL